jgi:chromosome segregation ATPase
MEEQKFGTATVGSNDELGAEIIAEQKKHAENELTSYKNQLDTIEGLLSRYSEQWDVEKERWLIILDNFEKIDPVWKYEESPRYNELNKKIMTYKYESENHQAEAQINKFNLDIENLKERIAAQEKEIAEIEAGEQSE